MKHNAIQFELTGMQSVLTLRGERAPAASSRAPRRSESRQESGQPAMEYDGWQTPGAGLTFDGEASFTDDRK